MDERLNAAVKDLAAKLAPQVGFDRHHNYVLPEEVLIWRLAYEAALWRLIAERALSRKSHG